MKTEHTTICFGASSIASCPSCYQDFVCGETVCEACRIDLPPPVYPVEELTDSDATQALIDALRANLDR